MIGAGHLALNTTFIPTFSMSGGTETTFVSALDGYTYKVHTFTSASATTFTVTGTGVKYDILMAGPGGEGGFINQMASGAVTAATGGGQGGAVFLNYNYTDLVAGSYRALVASNVTQIENATTFNTIYGAQKGGSGGSTGTNGVITNNTGGGGAATSGIGTAWTPSYNNNGGNGYPSTTATSRRGGGGGGGGWYISLPNNTTINGTTASATLVGSGGAGATIPAGLFEAGSLYYGAGGGGGAGTAGAVGLAGGTGAAAGSSTTTGLNATVNTGGGGGGIYGTASTSTAYMGGLGASGIIKIRYRIA